MQDLTWFVFQCSTCVVDTSGSRRSRRNRRVAVKNEIYLCTAQRCTLMLRFHCVHVLWGAGWVGGVQESWGRHAGYWRFAHIGAIAIDITIISTIAITSSPAPSPYGTHPRRCCGSQGGRLCGLQPPSRGHGMPPPACAARRLASSLRR